ncbi:MAG: DUF3747 domain-containing protein [Cyanobacteriota bacterium]|nr:DUF3747 domain-containing protein [Cyanobacteriota bacterium]
MMSKFWSAALTVATLFNASLVQSASASLFNNTEVQQDRFVAIASPFGVERRRYSLLLVEQVANTRPCWRESGSSPIRVDPLLLDFDFTGVCKRGTDGNGYSIRIDDEDFGGRYLLSIVRDGDDLLLVGSSIREPNTPPVIIGRTNGIADGHLKINLNPGWRFSKRTYQGQVLDHVYFTGSSAAIAQPLPSAPSARPVPSQPLPPAPSARPVASPPAVPLPTAPALSLPAPDREIIFTRPEPQTQPSPQQPSPPDGRTVPVF